MAAVTAAIMCQLRAGDHIVAARALFGSCRWVVETLAPKYGIECTLIDGKNLENWEKAVRPNTRVFFLESPTNPMLGIADIPELTAAAHAAGAIVVTDNTFSTPLVQQPLALGSDVVLHSVTKYLAGHSDVVLGAVVTSNPDIRAALLHNRTIHGGIAGPFEAWLALRGLRARPLAHEGAPPGERRTEGCVA
jgi:O-succinylhomoserine sulfhydrylase